MAGEADTCVGPIPDRIFGLCEQECPNSRWFRLDHAVADPDKYVRKLSDRNKSLTSHAGGHPSFRVYDVDPDTYEIMDAHTFIANMSDPNFQTKRKLRWLPKIPVLMWLIDYSNLGTVLFGTRGVWFTPCHSAFRH